MDNAMNMTSEEELLRLRSEGKISGAEYGELLGAMKRTPARGERAREPESNTDASKRRLGLIGFYLMLAGIVAPIVVFLVCFAITGGGEGDVIFSGCLVLCALLEMSAFVFGVISWPDVFGKATVAVVAAMAVLALMSIS